MTNLIFNQELNGIELYFDKKPLQNIIDALKSNGFRWSGFKKCWYAKQSEAKIKLAEELTGNIIEENIITATTQNLTITAPITKSIKTIKQQNNKSLWERCQFVEGSNCLNPDRYKFVGSNYSGLSVKETAALMRKELKVRFPEVKFSITSDYNSIDITIKSSPYTNTKPENRNNWYVSEIKKWDKENNPELTAIYTYCESFLNSYNWDDSDSQSDYFNSHFYDHVYISSDYIQTEQTEAIKNDIADFKNQFQKSQQEAEEQKEKEYQEYITKQKAENEQHLIRVEEEKKEIEIINNSIEVKDIEGIKQYFVIGSEFANLNKNDTLNEYKKEIEKGDFYLNNIKITKEIHFQNEQALNYYSNMLLNDFDFLIGTGGSFTDDNRVNTMTDYENMTEEERKTVVFYLQGVAIYYNGELQFVVDTQGYSYSRYVGLVNNVTIQKELITTQVLSNEEVEKLKATADELTDISVSIIEDLKIVKTWNTENWIEYKDLMKEQLKKYNIKLSKPIIQQLPEDLEELKVSMYKLLKEVDGIQEQFKTVDLQQGQKVTIFNIGDMGMMSTSRIAIDKVEFTKYAQYDNAVKLTFKPEGKRNLYYNHYYRDMLVYEGWLELPKTVLYNVKESNGMIISSTKYMSCDKKMYDDIIKHFQDQSILPIVNTHKPIF